MKNATIVGRYHVFKYRGRWLVVSMNKHGDSCISKHASQVTALAAAKRYDESDRRRHKTWRDVVHRFV